MKKTLTALLALCIAAAFCACGSAPASSVTPASVAPASVSAAPTAPPSSAAASSAVPGHDAELGEILEELAAAAGLEATIDVIELDLKAGGVDTDAIEAFAGLQAQNYSDNGGMALVILAKTGRAADVRQGLETFKAGRMDERYTEFAVQVANTAQARIQSSGDTVVFVVSSTGAFDAVDAALSARGFS